MRRLTLLKGLVGASFLGVGEALGKSMDISIQISDDDGSGLNGTVAITVTASPPKNLQRIDLAIDGAVVATATSSPLNYQWDTTKSADGTHQLDATAVYKSRRSTAHLAVTVNNAVVPPPPPPPTGFDLPTHSIVMPAPGIGFWLAYDSPTTQKTGTDGDTFRQRMVVWSTGGGMSSAFYSGRRMYAIAGFCVKKGFPGRFLNWHNQPNDNPWSWSPPYCPPNWHPSGVSPMAVEYWGDEHGLTLVDVVEQTTQCGGSGDHEHTIISNEDMLDLYNEWIWLILEFDWGRRDQGPGGAARVWVSGEDTPRVSLPAPRHTHYYDQHQTTFIQGMYHCETCAGHDRDHEFEIAATRFGRTPKECYEDRPVFLKGGSAGQEGGTSYGSFTAIAPRKSDEVKIPASLQW